eukprot:scaffold3199_cov165-Amphora_coffeaeformis.AAC.13
MKDDEHDNNNRGEVAQLPRTLTRLRIFIPKVDALRIIPKLNSSSHTTTRKQGRKISQKASIHVVSHDRNRRCH